MLSEMFKAKFIALVENGPLVLVLQQGQNDWDYYYFFQISELFDNLIFNHPSSLLKCGALIPNGLTSRPVNHPLTTPA